MNIYEFIFKGGSIVVAAEDIERAIAEARKQGAGFEIEEGEQFIVKRL